MKTNCYLLIFPLIIALTICACTKQETFGPVPVITLKSTEKLTTHAQQDSVVFIVSYKDDGDLGDADEATPELFLTDLRDNSVYPYHIEALSPIGSNAQSKGDIRVVLQNPGIINQLLDSEQATYTIYVGDRAGNFSNILTTPAITILKN